MEIKKVLKCPFCKKTMEKMVVNSDGFYPKYKICKNHDKWTVLIPTNEDVLYILSSFMVEPYIEYSGYMFCFGSTAKSREFGVYSVQKLSDKRHFIRIHKLNKKFLIFNDLEWFNPIDMTFDDVIEKCELTEMTDF